MVIRRDSFLFGRGKRAWMHATAALNVIASAICFRDDAPADVADMGPAQQILMFACARLDGDEFINRFGEQGGTL